MIKGSFRLFTIFGIAINIHITFFLLLFLFLTGGVKWLFLICGVFVFVVLHELCHSLVARGFGINVKEITLLPIGGIASMTKMPERPFQEFLVSLAGPAFNILVIILFYYPMKYLLGTEVLFHQLSTATWPLTIAYLYWINLILALFNLLPAFPMDGGRILRSLLASRIGRHKATKVAATLGHIFALFFAYTGIVHFNIILIAIAIFIYMAASNEEMQMDVKETLKKFKVRDILPTDFFTVEPEATFAKVLELIFHSHQEDFPVVEAGKLVGFISRQDIIRDIHQFGMEKKIGETMRRDFPVAKDTDSLDRVQNIMQENEIRAVPVMRDKTLVGVVTIEDIGRVYAMISRE